MIIPNFNPRSREGSDAFFLFPLNLLSIISIHAPAKGATSVVVIGANISAISIHAPAKGATTLFSFSFTNVIFQSTLPRRERPTIDPKQYTLLNFNPRSREGSDNRPEYNQSKHYKFQSTLPRRERQTSSASGNHGADFNPRSREGSDPLMLRYYRLYQISIHAPAKGATLWRF